MKQVTREEFQALMEAKLLHSRPMNKNYKVVNRKKKSKRKKYFVVEEHKILEFLGEKEDTEW